MAVNSIGSTTGTTAQTGVTAAATSSTDEAQDRAWLAANSLAAAGQGGTSDAG